MSVVGSFSSFGHSVASVWNLLSVFEKFLGIFNWQFLPILLNSLFRHLPLYSIIKPPRLKPLIFLSSLCYLSLSFWSDIFAFFNFISFPFYSVFLFLLSGFCFQVLIFILWKFLFSVYCFYLMEAIYFLIPWRIVIMSCLVFQFSPCVVCFHKVLFFFPLFVM